MATKVQRSIQKLWHIVLLITLNYLEGGWRQIAGAENAGVENVAPDSMKFSDTIDISTISLHFSIVEQMAGSAKHNCYLLT